MKMEELEASIKNSTLQDADPDPIDKTSLISKLDVARVQSANEKRLARKTIWLEQARKEALQLTEFREENMLDVFPEVVWRLILESLEDPKDKALVSNMNLLWRDLLKTERTTFLFHAVFPLLHPYLPRNSLLALRKISREWKGSFDHQVQNKSLPASHFLEGLKQVEARPQAKDVILYHFHRSDVAVAEFFQRFGGSPEINPFISRKVLLGFPPSMNGEEEADMFSYWGQVNNLLFSLGPQLWMAIIYVDKHPSPVEVYDQLWVLLRHMPNLKYLKLDGGVDYFRPALRRPKEYYSGMEERMRTYVQLPDLPNLKTFIAEDVPAPLVTGAVIKYSSTLETLSIAEVVELAQNANFNNSVLPNLKKFFHCSAKNLCMAEPDFVVDWPGVEEVCLQYTELQAAKVPGIFKCLNQFGGTLKILTLHLHKHDGSVGKLSDGELKVLSLELPHLEELHLSVCRINVKTIDFILPMAALKKLTILYEKYEKAWSSEKKKNKPVDEAGAGPSSKVVSNDNSNATATAVDSSSGEIIKFGNYTNRLYDSNIWRLLPELKSVIIAVVTITVRKDREGNKSMEKNEAKRKEYTREGYKQYCNANDGIEIPSPASDLK